VNLSTLKLAISGPTGSGKTTLAKALADKLGLPVLPEDMADSIQKEQAFRQLKKTETTEKSVLDQALAAWAQSHVDWFRRRANSYAETPGFVADRWEADLLDTWLIKLGSQVNEKYTEALYNSMRNQSKQLDFVIMLPFQPAMGGERNDEGHKRAGGFAARLTKTAMTRGLIQQCTGLKVIDLPVGHFTVEQRVDIVLKVFQSANIH